MKKLLTIFLLLTLCCVCVFGVSAVAYAEEVPEQPVETVSETEAEDLETIKEKLNALIAKYNAEIETTKNFFISRVLPALIAGGVSTLIGLIFGVKGRKGKKEYLAKYNEVAIAYNEQEKRLKALTVEKEQQNILFDFFNNKLLPSIEKLKTENAELKQQLAKIENKQDRIIAGATQAWAECPEAIRAVNKETNNE